MRRGSRAASNWLQWGRDLSAAETITLINHIVIITYPVLFENPELFGGFAVKLLFIGGINHDFCSICRIRAPPAFSSSPRRSRLSGNKNRIRLDLALQESCQQSGLNFKQPTVAHAIVKKRMRYQGIHSPFIGMNQPLSSIGREGYGRPHRNKILGLNHAVVDCTENGGFCNQGTERLHQIQGKRWAPKSRLMIKPYHWIESNRITGYRTILGKDAVCIGEHGVDRIARRSPIPLRKVKAKSLLTIAGLLTLIIPEKSPK